MRCFPIFVVMLLACLLPVCVGAQPGFDLLPIPQETDIYRLTDLLDAHDVSIRVQAATRLQQLGDARGVNALGALLKDREASTRLAAVRALGTFVGVARAAEMLVPVLHDADATVRVEAAFSLGNLHDARAVSPLLGLLADKTLQTRERAVSLLGPLRDPHAVPALIGALHDPAVPVRLAAVRALAFPNDTRAAEPLLALIGDKDETVRREIIALLGQLVARCPDPAVRMRIADALLAGAKSPQVNVREAALTGLGNLRDPRVVPALLTALDDPAPGARSNAIRALSLQRDARVVPALLAHADDKDINTRHAIISALGELGDPRAADILLAALGDKAANTRNLAVQYIFNMLPDAPARIADRLAILLASTDEGIHDNAVAVLGRMGDPRALEPTLVLLKNPQEYIRQQALQSLLHIDNPRATAALVAALPDLDENMRNTLMWQNPQHPRLLALAREMLKQPKIPLRIWAIQVTLQSNSPQTAEMLIAALHDEDPTVRVAAMQGLERFGDGGQLLDDTLLPEITALAAAADPSVRAAAVRLLGPLRRPSMRKLLLAALHDPDKGVRMAAAGSLGSLDYALPRNDAQIVTALIAAGKDAEPSVRSAALSALQSYAHDPRVPGILYAATNDPTTEVRIAGTRAYLYTDDRHTGDVCLALLKRMTAAEMMQLGLFWQIIRSKDPRVLDALLALAPAADEQAKHELVDELGNSRDPRAIPTLLTMFQQTAVAKNPTDWDRATFSRSTQSLSFFSCGQYDNAFSSLGASAVEPLCKLLAADHRASRALAMVELAQLKDARAVEPLLAIARSDDAVLRCYAVRALGELGDVHTLAPLLVCLKDKEPGVRAEAAQALGHLGDTRAVVPLLDALHDPDADMQYAAATGLSLLKDPRAVEPLLAQVKNGADAGARRQAIDVLGSLHDLRAVEPLIAAVHDPDPNLGNRAIAALGELRDRRAVEPLLAIVKSRPHGIYYQGLQMVWQFGGSRNNKSEQAQLAVTALGKIGDPRAIDVLLQLLTENENGAGYQGGPIWEVLSAFADHRVIDALLSAPYGQNTDYYVPTALTKIGVPAIPALLTALADPKTQPRRRASQALAGIYAANKTADAHASELLLAALKDDDATVCGNVTTALLAIDEPRALPPIADLLSDQSKPAYMQVVSAAQFATDPHLLKPLLVIATQADGARYCRSYALQGIQHIVQAHPGAEAVKPAVAPLLGLLGEPEIEIRGSAVTALGYLRDPRITPALLPLLHDGQPEIRYAAAQALAALGDQRAVAPLLAMLHDLSAHYPRVEVVQALGKFNTPQVSDALIAALQDPAFNGPGYQSNPATVDNPGSVREQAALTLGALGDTRAVPALIDALDYGYLSGRRRAAEALGMLKDRRAIEPLITALRHFAGDAAHAPADALKALTGQDFGLDAERWQAWWDGAGKKGLS